MEFYTYIYYIDGTPSYVGHGKGDTCYRHDKIYSGMLWHRYLRQKIREGARIEIVKTYWADKNEAQDQEYYLIKKIGRLRLNEGPLLNHNAGRKPRH